MTIVSSTLLAADTDPSSINKTDLWRPPAFFLHDWNEKFLIREAYMTQRTSARSNAEQRFGLAQRPHRTVSYKLLGWQERGQSLTHLRNILMRLGKARSLWPLMPDRRRLTGPTDWLTHPNRFDGDFTDARYYAGARVLVYNLANGPLIDDFAICTITSVDPAGTWIQLDCDLDYIPAHEPEYVDSGDNRAGIGLPLSVTGLSWEAGDYVFGFLTSTGTPIITLVTIDGDNMSNWGSWASYTPKIYCYARQMSSSGSGNLVFAGLGGNEIIASGLVLRDCDGTLYDTDEITSVALGEMLLSVDSDYSVGLSMAIFAGVNNKQGISFTSIAPAVDRESEAGTGGLFSQSGDLLSTRGLGTGIGITHGATVTNQGQAHHAVGLVTAGSYKEDVIGFSEGLIVPLIEGDLSMQHLHNLLSGYHADGTIVIRETIGQNTLPGVVEPGSSPTGFDTYNSYPVLNGQLDWDEVSLGFDRPGREHPVGTGVKYDVYGNRALVKFGIKFRNKDRSTAWSTKEFFDSRGGRLYPFWVIRPSWDYVHLGTAGTTTIIEGVVTEEDDFDFWEFIAIEKTDGNWVYARVASASHIGANTALTTIENLGTIAAEDVRRMTAMHMARFDVDAIPEEWLTDTFLDCTLPVYEVDYDLETTDTTFALPDLCQGGDCDDPWEPIDPDDLDPCADNRCGGTSPISHCCCCMDYAATYECWCYTGSIDDEDECDCWAGCRNNGYLSLSLAPISCISDVARWEVNDAYVTLNGCTKAWGSDLGSYECCEDVEDGSMICACPAGYPCSPSQIVTESCSSYLKEVPCPGDTQYPGENCNYVPVKRLTAPGCGPGSSKCDGCAPMPPMP